MRRSLGKMSKRSRLLGKKNQILTVSELVKEFAVGADVVVAHVSRFSGMPHPRYRGRHGKVIGRRGKAYVVRIRDGDSIKELIIPPVHLQSVK